MTEAEARAALRAFVGDVEPWIADQPWKAVAGGWSIAGELQGWRFRLEVVPGGVDRAGAVAKQVTRPRRRARKFRPQQRG